MDTHQEKKNQAGLKRKQKTKPLKLGPPADNGLEWARDRNNNLEKDFAGLPLARKMFNHTCSWNTQKYMMFTKKR